MTEGFKKINNYNQIEIVPSSSNNNKDIIPCPSYEITTGGIVEKTDLSLWQIITLNNTSLELSLLLVAMVSPILYVVIFLVVLNEPLVTLILYEMTTLTTFPILYIIKVNNKKHPFQFKNYFTQEYSISLQIITGTLGGLLVAISLLAILYGVAELTSLINYNGLYKLNQTKIEIFITCFMLGITNPFMEEFFWRSFLPISLMGGQIEQSLYKEKLILFVNAFYTLYHFPVVILFVNQVYPAFIVISVLFVGGRIFFLLKHKIGYISSSLTHMGADMAIVCLILYYNINHQ